PARIPARRPALARRALLAARGPRAPRPGARAAALRRRARARHALEPLRRPVPRDAGRADAAARPGRAEASLGARRVPRPRRGDARARAPLRPVEAAGRVELEQGGGADDPLAGAAACGRDGREAGARERAARRQPPPARLGVPVLGVEAAA